MIERSLRLCVFARTEPVLWQVFMPSNCAEAAYGHHETEMRYLFETVVRDGRGNIIARKDSNINTVRDRQGNIIARIDGNSVECSFGFFCMQVNLRSCKDIAKLSKYQFVE